MQQERTFESQLLSAEIQKKADVAFRILTVLIAISLIIGIISIAGLILVLEKAI